MAKLKEKDANRRFRIKAIIIFASALLLYFAILVFLYLRFKSEQQYLIVGLIIGSIYVLIALYYLYGKFLEYGTLPKSKISKISDANKNLIKQNIYIWMLQWILPTLLIQFFVTFSFIMTLERFPFKKCVYTHPYEHGLTYKALVDNKKTLEELSLYIKGKTLAKLADEYDKKKRDYSTSDEASYISKLFSEKGEKENQEIINSLYRNKIESTIYSIPFFIAFAFGFLGALIYTLRDTASRFFNDDLYPSNFVRYLIRFIFAPSLCVVIAYYISNDWWVNGGPLLFFIVGYFPQTALDYIKEGLKKSFGIKNNNK